MARRSGVLLGALAAAASALTAGPGGAYVTPEWLPLLPDNGQSFTAGPYGYATPADIGFAAAWLGGTGSALGDRCGTPYFTIASWPTIEGAGDGGFPSRNVGGNAYGTEVPGPYSDLWANSGSYPLLEPGTYYWYAWAPVKYDFGYDVTSCGFYPSADDQWARSTVRSFTVLPAPPAAPAPTVVAARPATAPPFYIAPGITSTGATARGRQVRVSIACPGGCPNAYGFEISLSGKARVRPGSKKRRWAWRSMEGSHTVPRATKNVTMIAPASWRGARVTVTVRAWDLRYGTPLRQAVTNGGSSFNTNKQTRLTGLIR